MKNKINAPPIRTLRNESQHDSKEDAIPIAGD